MLTNRSPRERNLRLSVREGWRFAAGVFLFLSVTLAGVAQSPKASAKSKTPKEPQIKEEMVTG
jgi:hypothetical protein